MLFRGSSFQPDEVNSRRVFDVQSLLYLDRIPDVNYKEILSSLKEMNGGTTMKVFLLLLSNVSFAISIAFCFRMSHNGYEVSSFCARTTFELHCISSIRTCVPTEDLHLDLHLKAFFGAIN